MCYDSILCETHNENVQKCLERFDKSTLPRATTFQWHGLFTSGKESVKDEERRRRPTKTKIIENIAQVEQAFKKDPPVSCRMIVENTGILKTVVQYILLKPPRV